MNFCLAVSETQARCLWQSSQHPGSEHRWGPDGSAVADLPLGLRRATYEDRYYIWAWRNAPDVRAVSLDPNPIPWAAHLRWYERRLLDSPVSLFVVMRSDGERIGTLRLDRHGPLGYVSIILDPGMRGRRLATPALQLLDAPVISGDCLALLALIKVPNPRSHGAFIRAGYTCGFHDGAITLMVKSHRGASVDGP